ncbi:MAG: site-specific DNA-methyltransferase, partial [Lentimicrobiaceae bacterium]|nr:site-specific DNA-methyltransferase [Lentimicrobiaceae bacterium]
MNGYSQSPKDERIEKLKAIMPEIFDEGKIDWEKLRAVLGDDVAIADERYRLNWAGKSDAFRVMQEPSSATFVPYREESVDFDNTQNIFIEGENMEVLKVLQKSYFGKVKMIYIDPPYNTGNDSFIYPDRFAESREEYMRRVGDKDDDGYMLRDGMFRKNSKENGQYHSNWLNMMMPRLYLAKSLLREDGVVFVSIDDNEVHNLRLLMNEIFGEENFVAEIIWKSKSGGANDSRYIAVDHEYILCFAKDATEITQFIDKNATVTTSYNCKDENGEYSLDRLDKQSLGYIESLDFPIIGPDGKTYTVEHKNPDIKVARWRWSRDTVADRYDELVFKNGYVYTKNYKKDSNISRSLLIEDRFGRTRTGKTDFTSLFGVAYFSSPKPVKLVYYLADIINDSDAVILDFFAGSGTTAHAVMQLNREDGGNRKYICVQLPEPCDENSE